MPHFYLHVRSTDGLATDPEGADFRDLEAVRKEARKGMRSLVADALFSGKELLVRSVEITDDQGNALGQVTLAAAISGVIPVDDAFVHEVREAQAQGAY
ncbi:hypothetical protein E2F50_08740 [Rhizobium deserti]|uniref:DUF6894 domain-containing protein n=1 Tax=Rhizobium deserti TaxID=2547961 RepID=A0A4R5UJF2_9HYPH|nr:hypothetical protein [Rhizobium deserti]TDK36982.1 hypothetical protein E2F50_08740 [Rhizobium deserti]